MVLYRTAPPLQGTGSETRFFGIEHFTPSRHTQYSVLFRNITCSECPRYLRPPALAGHHARRNLREYLHHQYTDESQNLRNYLEAAYESYPILILLLAVAEQQVIAFSSALKNAVEYLGVDIKNGYYYVHGTTEEDTKNASDDLHENDLWLLLTHSLHLSSAPALKEAALVYCNFWDNFWAKVSNIPSTKVID